MNDIFNDDLIKQIKNIPFRVLRKLVPDITSRKKIELANCLFSRDPKKLQDLAIIHTISKEQSIYLLKIKEGFNFPKEESIFLSLKKSQKRSSDEDFIVNCNDIFRDPQKGDIYISLKIHSSRKRYHGEDPTTLERKEFELRKGFNVFLIAHPDDRVVECRTSRLLRCNYAIKALNLIFFNKKEALEKIIFPPQKQIIIDKDIRYKQASISELNFAGTNEIILKGEDVEHTLKTILESYKLNFEKHDGKISYHKSELTNTPMKFYPDGRIIIKKTIDNPYDTIRTLL